MPKKKAKKSVRPGREEPGRKPGRRKWLFALIGISAAVTGFLFASHHVRSSVSEYAGFNLTVEKVELDAAACEWLPEEAREVIEAIPLGVSDLNLISEDTLPKVYRRLVANPWVKDVYCIEKVFPDRIKFSLVLRRPVAWIRHGRGMYLADAECVRLPVSKKSSLGIRHLPLIEGLRTGIALPAPGAPWRSRQIAEGICIAGYLLTCPELLTSETGRIRNIDVSGAMKEGRGVVLVTEDKRRVEWGRTQLSQKARLVSDSEKLSNLQLILEGKSSIGDRTYYRLWTKPLTAGRLERTAGNLR